MLTSLPWQDRCRMPQRQHRVCDGTDIASEFRYSFRPESLYPDACTQRSAGQTRKVKSGRIAWRSGTRKRIGGACGSKVTTDGASFPVFPLGRRLALQGFLFVLRCGPAVGASNTGGAVRCCCVEEMRGGSAGLPGRTRAGGRAEARRRRSAWSWARLVRGGAWPA